jgi:hypothetical protein
LLVDRFYLRGQEQAYKAKGGRPSEKYEVNPNVFSGT